jgi:hypothetical protein
MRRAKRTQFTLFVAGVTLLVVGVPIAVFAVPQQACGMDEFECNPDTPRIIATFIVVLVSIGLALFAIFWGHRGDESRVTE